MLFNHKRQAGASSAGSLLCDGLPDCPHGGCTDAPASLIGGLVRHERQHVGRVNSPSPEFVKLSGALLKKSSRSGLHSR
jgi:hypothetical protein